MRPPLKFRKSSSFTFRFYLIDKFISAKDKLQVIVCPLRGKNENSETILWKSNLSDLPRVLKETEMRGESRLDFSWLIIEGKLQNLNISHFFNYFSWLKIKCTEFNVESESSCNDIKYFKFKIEEIWIPNQLGEGSLQSRTWPPTACTGERREVGGQDKTSEGEIRILQLTISPELYLNSSMKNPFNKNLSTASEISLSAEDLIWTEIKRNYLQTKSVVQNWVLSKD